MSALPQELQPLRADDAEVSLLGAALSGYPDIDELARIVAPSDFYAPAREATWSAILRVHAQGNTPDAVSVRVALDETRERHDPLELLRYAEMCPMVASAPWYAEQVALAAGHRAIAAAGIKVTQLGTTLGDLDERREQARQTIDEACRGRNLRRARTLADVLPGVIESAEKGQTNTLSSGWVDLDGLTDGIAPGRLVVVGARPGVGKSIFGTNLALHVTRHHRHAALIASMEMPEEELGQRLVAARASVNLTAIIKGQVDEASWGRIAQCYDELAGLPLTIDDTPAQTVQHIRAQARDIQRHREDLALIVVDYLQLMATSGRSDNRAQELAEVTRGLKLLARETGACVLALAQVNRESTRRNDRPRMSDLRESGAIEADADQVLLLHQPDDEIPEVEVIVDKNRHGPKGVRKLDVWGHYARLVTPARPLRALP